MSKTGAEGLQDGHEVAMNEVLHERLVLLGDVGQQGLAPGALRRPHGLNWVAWASRRPPCLSPRSTALQ